MLSKSDLEQVTSALKSALEPFELNWHDYSEIVYMNNAPRLPGVPLFVPMSFQGYHLQEWAAVRLDCSAADLLRAYSRYVLAVVRQISVKPSQFFADELGIQPHEANYLFNFATRRRLFDSPENLTMAGIACAGLAVWNFEAPIIGTGGTSFVVRLEDGLIGVSERRLIHPLDPDIEGPAATGLIPKGPNLWNAWSGIYRGQETRLAEKAYKHFRKRAPRVAKQPNFEMLFRLLRNRARDVDVRVMLRTLCFEGLTEREARYAVKG